MAAISGDLKRNRRAAAFSLEEGIEDAKQNRLHASGGVGQFGIEKQKADWLAFGIGASFCREACARRARRARYASDGGPPDPRRDRRNWPIYSIKQRGNRFGGEFGFEHCAVG